MVKSEKFCKMPCTLLERRAGFENCPLKKRFRLKEDENIGEQKVKYFKLTFFPEENHRFCSFCQNYENFMQKNVTNFFQHSYGQSELFGKLQHFIQLSIGSGLFSYFRCQLVNSNTCLIHCQSSPGFTFIGFNLRY